MTFFHFPFHELFKILFATNKRPVMLNISFFPFVFMGPLGDRPLRRETCQNIFSKDVRNIKSKAAGKKLQLHEVLKLGDCR